LAEDLVKVTINLGISFTSELCSTVFSLHFFLDLVGFVGTDVSPITEIFFLEVYSKACFFISLFTCCNCAMKKWAFFNCSSSSMIRLSLSLEKYVSVKALGFSSGTCDVCMTGILLASNLVTGLLGVVIFSGGNWSFFPLFLSC
jgi:hypothetical protein